jgi:hypothetical protein
MCQVATVHSPAALADANDSCTLFGIQGPTVWGPGVACGPQRARESSNKRTATGDTNGGGVEKSSCFEVS